MPTRLGRRRFGEFELNVDACELFRDGHRVRIQPQPLRVLAILVEHAGQVVSRDELRRLVWDEATFVEFDEGLNYCIRQIRLALHDEAATPVYIETLKRRGYRFLASVERIPVEEPAPVPPPAAETSRSPDPPRGEGPRLALYALVAIAATIALVAGLRLRQPGGLAYKQLTNFADAAFSPAVSPDGRMVAFIVGTGSGFPPVGEIYTMALPNGAAVQRTHDGWPKYGVAFSPDGSQITYTVSASQGWATSTLSAFGGEPQPLFANAAGLTWLDHDHALFGEIKTGLHMGLVTATASRTETRDIYLPEHERGMAHYGYASPDRKWVIVVEMGAAGAWQRCRLVPFDGSSAGVQVGPQGACMSAGWSPDGSIMYFTAFVDGSSHIWRQRFPSGQLEQISHGPSEEEGIAVAPDGRSIFTSVGIREDGVWMHGASGDRPVASQGHAFGLSFSRDGRLLYFIVKGRAGESANELWVTDLQSGKSESVVKGFAMLSYDISSDGTRVVFAALPAKGPTELWLTTLDRASEPRRIAAAGEHSPFFGPDDDVIFQNAEGARNYVFRMKTDGSNRSKAVDEPIDDLKGISPDKEWAVVMEPVDETPTTAVFAVPLRGGGARRLCPGECLAEWSPDGTRFYVQPFLQDALGKTVVLPVPDGQSLPELPPYGIRSAADAAALAGSTVVDLSRLGPAHEASTITAGPDNAFAYMRTVAHRNIFQIRLAD